MHFVYTEAELPACLPLLLSPCCTVVRVSSDFLAYSIILMPHAVKPLNKTGETGLFFFFIHILVCSEAYLWKRMLNVEREGGGRGDISQTFPPLWLY